MQADIATNTANIATNATDIADHIANDLDTDPTNEIQTLTSNDGSVSVTPNGNDFDLSITIPANNDNDPTNEIQDISTDGNAGNISISNGSTITLNVDDADNDPTNELYDDTQVQADIATNKQTSLQMPQILPIISLMTLILILPMKYKPLPLMMGQ